MDVEALRRSLVLGTAVLGAAAGVASVVALVVAVAMSGALPTGAPSPERSDPRGVVASSMSCADVNGPSLQLCDEVDSAPPADTVIKTMRGAYTLLIARGVCAASRPSRPDPARMSGSLTCVDAHRARVTVHSSDDETRYPWSRGGIVVGTGWTVAIERPETGKLVRAVLGGMLIPSLQDPTPTCTTAEECLQVGTS